jgi:hypothetical protein
MGQEDNFKGSTGKRFSSTNQPANSGRKKNVFKRFKEKFDLSADDVDNIIEYLLSQPIEKLQEIIKDPKQSVIVVNFATAVLTGAKLGDLGAIEKLLNRRIGKPKDRIEISGNIISSQYDLSKLTDEQLEQLENLLSGAVSESGSAAD